MDPGAGGFSNSTLNLEAATSQQVALEVVDRIPRRSQRIPIKHFFDHNLFTIITVTNLIFSRRP